MTRKQRLILTIATALSVVFGIVPSAFAMAKYAFIPFVACLGAYAVMSMHNPIQQVDDSFLTRLSEQFVISPWCLIPAVCMMKRPYELSGASDYELASDIQNSIIILSAAVPWSIAWARSCFLREPRESAMHCLMLR